MRVVGGPQRTCGPACVPFGAVEGGVGRVQVGMSVLGLTGFPLALAHQRQNLPCCDRHPARRSYVRDACTMHTKVEERPGRKP